MTEGSSSPPPVAPTPRVLVVKMSSMGDIIHTFPAISDLKCQLPEARVDWVVESGFADLAQAHPGVHHVIPISLRRWVKQRDVAAVREIIAWRRQLSSMVYDVVIDPQGLLKSSWVGSLPLAKEVHGFDKTSCREPLATWSYTHTHRISKDLHAVQRSRALFAAALGYDIPQAMSFGLRNPELSRSRNLAALIIGASWESKVWPDSHWTHTAKLALSAGYEVEVIWGDPSERQRALKIQTSLPSVKVSPARLSVIEVSKILARATVAIGLDTGFSHLSSALETPTVAIYGPTAPNRSGLAGQNDTTLSANTTINCPPCHKRTCQLTRSTPSAPAKCMASVTPDLVWKTALHQIGQKPSQQ